MRILAHCCALFAASTALAHDFWIEPSTFRPAIGRNITASLRVGQDFLGDAIPRSAQLMEAFVVRDSAGERTIDGFENQDPAGILRIDQPGLAIIGYRSKPYPLELAANKFEEFLRTEGLERISELRARRGESQKPDRERFVRYAKAIVVAGSTPAGPLKFNKPLHYRYELIPETNPMAPSPLRIRVLFEGKPLAGALVTAIHRDDPAARLSARSDASGRVTLPLPKNGVWLVKSVQMIPAPAGSNANWESLWASLTFER
ncbi:MAG TPA: DUF4198 domain-containing protein [Thermoanaerobaculia bacterium]